jgi:hypothetical protein
VICVAEAQSKIEREAIRTERHCLARAHPGARVENQTLDFLVSERKTDARSRRVGFANGEFKIARQAMSEALAHGREQPRHSRDICDLTREGFYAGVLDCVAERLAFPQFLDSFLVSIVHLGARPDRQRLARSDAHDLSNEL